MTSPAADAVQPALDRLMDSIGGMEALPGGPEAIVVGLQELCQALPPLVADGALPWEHLTFYGALGAFVDAVVAAAREEGSHAVG